MIVLVKLVNGYKNIGIYLPSEEAPTASIWEDLLPNGNPDASAAPNLENDEGPSRVTLNFNMLVDDAS